MLAYDGSCYFQLNFAVIHGETVIFQKDSDTKGIDRRFASCL